MKLLFWDNRPETFQAVTPAQFHRAGIIRTGWDTLKFESQREVKQFVYSLRLFQFFLRMIFYTRWSFSYHSWEQPESVNMEESSSIQWCVQTSVINFWNLTRSCNQTMKQINKTLACNRSFSTNTLVCVWHWWSSVEICGRRGAGSVLQVRSSSQTTPLSKMAELASRHSYSRRKAPEGRGQVIQDQSL